MDGRQQPRAQTAAPGQVLDLQSNLAAQQRGQTVEQGFGKAFTASGRRSVSIDFPVEGDAVYFQKLKDHAKLEIRSKTKQDFKQLEAFFILLVLLSLLGIGKAIHDKWNSRPNSNA